MKITDKIQRAYEDKRPFWSFEFFPPKTAQGVANLYDRLERMYSLGPEFIDVTWGAGGSNSDLVLEICGTAQGVYGLETCMHLTCTNMPREKIDQALREAKDAGIQNILALRGDPPRGQTTWTACDSGFAYAVDLVRYIREQYGDYFCVGVAGYPEGHTENPSKEEDLKHLKEKVDAGADYIVTQLFFDVDLFLEWGNKLREMGVKVPILPGLMPITTHAGFIRATTMCKTVVPQHVFDDLEPIKDDDQAVKDYGVKLIIDMVRRIHDSGLTKGVHFYTFNLETSTIRALEGLGYVPPVENVRPLPWNPSLSKKRAGENVRPIFWRNRLQSYIARTAEWDAYPNGRWGDSRSPAYGDLDIAHHGAIVSLKQPRDKAIRLWGKPVSSADIAATFAKYCRGQLSALPWSDTPLSTETNDLRTGLAALNEAGFLTINSQPPVNGAPSAHPVHGWGPKNGYVYQKSYVEFFVSPDQIDDLIARLDTNPDLTYYAVNKKGELRTNTRNDGPNAVTWGVFPGKEIIQPTIVEVVSFLAWKDEAFELWSAWARLFDEKPAEPAAPANGTANGHAAADDDKDSQTSNLLHSIADTWYLVNVVNNDFHQPAEALFAAVNPAQAPAEALFAAVNPAQAVAN
ncbi:methylenetetrahydrofolate reduct [Ramicandelaber brevisporus]|nr:methylenetetrahydrofolate reduct [Ramicandelaber brevisporus]